MTIRIWDPEVAGVRAFALDFVDADGNPQRLHGIKVDIRRANRGPKGEGVILFPDIYTTVPSDTFRIYGGVPCDFDHRGQLIKSYTFPVDMFERSQNWCKALSGSFLFCTNNLKILYYYCDLT